MGRPSRTTILYLDCLLWSLLSMYRFLFSESEPCTVFCFLSLSCGCVLWFHQLGALAGWLTLSMTIAWIGTIAQS